MDPSWNYVINNNALRPSIPPLHRQKYQYQDFQKIWTWFYQKREKVQQSFLHASGYLRSDKMHETPVMTSIVAYPDVDDKTFVWKHYDLYGEQWHVVQVGQQLESQRSDLGSGMVVITRGVIEIIIVLYDCE